MPGINAFGYRLASFCFGIMNEMSRIADPVNGEAKTVQVHRMNSGRRINDPLVDCFALFVSETFGRRPRLAVAGEYAVSVAKTVFFSHSTITKMRSCSFTPGGSTMDAPISRPSSP